MTSFRDLLSTTYEYKPYIRISDDFLDDFPWLHNFMKILSWTILTLNHTFGFILIYTKENDLSRTDKLRTQAAFNYTYFVSNIKYLSFQNL